MTLNVICPVFIGINCITVGSYLQAGGTQGRRLQQMSYLLLEGKESGECSVLERLQQDWNRKKGK